MATLVYFVPMKQALYAIIKPSIRWALQLFFANIRITNPALLHQKGPLLLVANHPNSFLDAILIGAMFKKPVHFLARGDAFNSTIKRKLLSCLQMIPIYRIRDGWENLHLNQAAFDACNLVLQQEGIVLIFIEGVCKHTHALQPFKKGAARIAFAQWQQQRNLLIMPLVLQYQSLWHFGTTVQLTLAQPMTKEQFGFGEEMTKNYALFNAQLYQIIDCTLHLALPITSGKNPLKWLAKIVHAPFYKPIQQVVLRITAGTVFYHSVLFAILWLLYPIYLLFIGMLLALLFNSAFASIGAFIWPCLAWCSMHRKG